MEKIWSRQSILSAWEDIFDLVLSRWDKHQEWSPWNCILLTKDEAAAHDRLVDIDEVSADLSCNNVERWLGDLCIALECGVKLYCYLTHGVCGSLSKGKMQGYCIQVILAPCFLFCPFTLVSYYTETVAIFPTRC